MKAKEILINAKALIETRGWCKDQYENVNGAMCSLGAVIKATSLATAEDDEYSKALEFLRNAGNEWSITRFNDSAASVEEIYASFDRAIKAAP